MKTNVFSLNIFKYFSLFCPLHTTSCSSICFDTLHYVMIQSCMLYSTSATCRGRPTHEANVLALLSPRWQVSSCSDTRVQAGGGGNQDVDVPRAAELAVWRETLLLLVHQEVGTPEATRRRPLCLSESSSCVFPSLVRWRDAEMTHANATSLKTTSSPVDDLAAAGRGGRTSLEKRAWQREAPPCWESRFRLSDERITAVFIISVKTGKSLLH